MLLQEYDDSKAIIEPSTFYNKVDNFPKTALSFFSKHIMENILKNFDAVKIGCVENANSEYPIYKIIIDNHAIAVYQSAVGSPAASAQFDEIIQMGVTNLLLVGSCGCLDKKIEDMSIIIPIKSIRDEGTSYHYLPERDMVDINKKMVDKIEEVMDRNKIKYFKDINWTTDAMYRETVEKVQKRKVMGAITVDMECSAMAAVAEYRGVNFGQFFYANDNLDGEEYDPRSLVNQSEIDYKNKVIALALECVCNIDKMEF